jgi:8-oxo-dGTP pyrophosphatase MutT (NUDIX family)
VSLRDASTVILLRRAPDAPGEPFRIFFVKRHRKSGFLANAHVFPGGKLEPGDSDPRLVGRSRGLAPHEAAALLGGGLAPDAATALYYAALRETFEEAGVLLAERAHGDVDHGFASRLEQWRGRLQRDEAGLLEMVEAEDLVLLPGAMRFWSRWVTPTIEPRRFDTRFFVALMPPLQRALHDDLETTGSDWLSPTEALRDYESGRIQLAPPTLRTILELSEHEDPASVLAASEQRPRDPVMPVAVPDGDGGMRLALQGDPRYPGQDPLSARLDRFVLESGRWRSLRA